MTIGVMARKPRSLRRTKQSRSIQGKIASSLKSAPRNDNVIFAHPEAGDVVVIDDDGGIRLSFEPESACVVGIISTNPAQILRDDLQHAVPVALSGIVPCKATAENGPIRPGDLLVSSSMAGYAMRAGKNPHVGTIIGKALSKLEKDKGTVDVLVMLR